MSKFLRSICHSLGFNISDYPDKFQKLKLDIIKNNHIQFVLDVGGSEGFYGSQLRKIGYNKTIVSFEPLSFAFKKLQVLSQKDPRWLTANYALGSEASFSILNVAYNSLSSSILPMLESHIQSAPMSKYIGMEKIAVKRLDDVLFDFVPLGENIFLKIDVQGFEKQVLEGATNVLDLVYGIELEMSMKHLYQGELLYFEMIDYLQKKGFHLVGIKDVFRDRNTLELLQIDGLFVKSKAMK
jgi:FkbM family methyltransferase